MKKITGKIRYIEAEKIGYYIEKMREKNWDFGKNLDNLAKTETILLKMCDNLDNIYVKTE